MKLILRLLINTLTLLLVTQFLEGVQVDSFYFAFIAAIVIGLLNAVIRPLLLLLTLPINIVTLGLFTFVVNGLLVWFAASFLEGFAVDGFIPAVFVALVLWAMGVITNWFIHDQK